MISWIEKFDDLIARHLNSDFKAFGSKKSCLRQQNCHVLFEWPLIENICSVGIGIARGLKRHKFGSSSLKTE